MTRRVETITCNCCHLRQRVRCDEHDEPPPICAACYEHRGRDEAMSARRESEHLAAHIVRYEAASRAADEAVAERERAREQMKAAFRSRDALARVLLEIAEMHTMRPNGRCSCGMRRDCRIADLVSRPWVDRHIKNAESREAALARELSEVYPSGGERDTAFVEAQAARHPPAPDASTA